MAFDSGHSGTDQHHCAMTPESDVWKPSEQSQLKKCSISVREPKLDKELVCLFLSARLAGLGAFVAVSICLNNMYGRLCREEG